ncbi:MAG: hypothetical protein JXR63_00560 [Spirochaetales bacterium]|nr:hypothetical protein [Spirochaetales bacterium]
MNIKTDIKGKTLFKNFLTLYIYVVTIVAFFCIDRFTSIIEFFWSEDFSYFEKLTQLMMFMENNTSMRELFNSEEYRFLAQQTINQSMFLAITIYLSIFLIIYTVLRILQILIESLQINGINFSNTLSSKELGKKAALFSLLFPLGPLFIIPLAFAHCYKLTINRLSLNEEPLIIKQSIFHLWFIFVATTYLPVQSLLRTISSETTIQNILISSVIVIAGVPIFFATSYKWLLTFQFKERIITPGYKYFDAIGFFFKHTLITIASLGIYYPIFLSKGYEYLAENMATQPEGEEISIIPNFNHKKGLIIFWKYFLLTLVTAGIAYPILLEKRLHYIAESISSDS